MIDGGTTIAETRITGEITIDISKVLTAVTPPGIVDMGAGTMTVGEVIGATEVEAGAVPTTNICLVLHTEMPPMTTVEGGVAAETNTIGAVGGDLKVGTIEETEIIKMMTAIDTTTRQRRKIGKLNIQT